MDLSRRRLIYSALFGAGGVGLYALATGIPRSVLRNPLASGALAQEPTGNKVLILSSAAAGDPVNGNVPGTYGAGNDALVHPLGPTMAPTEYMLGDQSVTAAKPWADLPENVRSRMAFFHHSTYANSHPSHPKVMRLTGNISGNEMLLSFLAKQIAPNLETTQMEPISLGARSGSELLSFEGRTLSAVRPVSLKQVLGNPTGALGQLQDLRDRRVDELHTLFKEEGTENHRRMLDRFAQSRSEARSISLDLLDRLDAIANNNVEGQITAAPVLAAMNVAPVITIRVPFGGDNHNDQDLVKESEQTVSGVAALGQLVQNIDGMRAEGILAHEVVVGTLNVFGRTLSRARKGQNGRDHNGRHHVTVLIGDSIKPAVVGGVQPEGNDFGASAFDSATGMKNPDGDITYEDTFGSVAKTMGRALGVDQATLDETITSGKTLDIALK